MPQRASRHGYLYLFACLLLWSGFMLMARLGGKTPLTAYDLLALRLGTASVVLLCLPRPPLAAWRDRRLWLLALIGCIGFCLLCYSAVRWVPAAHLALLVAGIQPFMMALLLLLLGQGWPQRAARPGYAVMSLGLGLLAWPLFAGQALPGQWLGDGMLLTAGVLWALYALLAKRWGYAPWLLTSFVTLASHPALFAGVSAVAAQRPGGNAVADDREPGAVSRHQPGHRGHVVLPARCRFTGPVTRGGADGADPGADRHRRRTAIE